ncbi:MAG: DUF6263 family protein [Planctomycetota bacterium]|jgi:hypothetical protein
MKAFKITAFAMIVALAAAAAQPAMGAGVTIRYKYNVGDVRVVKQSEKSVISVMEMEIIQEQSKTMELTVLEVKDGVATVSVKITRVVSNTSNPMAGEQSFDSDDGEEPDDPQLASLAYMVNKKFTMKTDERGKILDVKGFSKIGEAIIKKMEEASDGTPQAMMRLQMVKGTLTDEAMKKQLEQGATTWPEEPVEAGSEWKDDTSIALPMMGKLKLVTETKVESVEGFVVKGSVKGNMKSEGEDEGEEEDEGGMGRMIEILDGKITGTFELDMDKGHVVKRVQKTKMSIKNMMGQEMPVVSTSTQELLKFTPGGPGEGSGGKEEGSGKKDGDF